MYEEQSNSKLILCTLSITFWLVRNMIDIKLLLHYNVVLVIYDLQRIITYDIILLISNWSKFLASTKNTQLSTNLIVVYYQESLYLSLTKTHFQKKLKDSCERCKCSVVMVRETRCAQYRKYTKVIHSYVTLIYLFKLGIEYQSSIQWVFNQISFNTRSKGIICGDIMTKYR